MQFIELFCGIGGFRKGLERVNGKIDTEAWRKRVGDSEGRSTNPAGGGGRAQQTYDCVWANDNDKYACRIYRKQFGTEELVEADIRTVNPNTIPDFDLLTAGFPCQSFSVAGKRKGFTDTRGTLFHEICRVAQAKKPALLLLENVKGLLSHDEGLTFQIILESLAELGYWCEWQVLNSKHYGVPQNRERVFIIGHLGERGAGEVFPIIKGNGGVTSGNGTPTQTCPTLDRRVGDSTHRSPYVVAVGSQNPTVRSGGRGSLDRHAWDTIQIVDFNQDGNTYMKDHSAALRSPKASQSNLLMGKRIRRLSPVECERLQSFPDHYTAKGIDRNGNEVNISDTRRYRALGNAVTVNVIERLGCRLLEVNV